MAMHKELVNTIIQALEDSMQVSVIKALSNGYQIRLSYHAQTKAYEVVVAYTDSEGSDCRMQRGESIPELLRLATEDMELKNEPIALSPYDPLPDNDEFYDEVEQAVRSRELLFCKRCGADPDQKTLDGWANFSVFRDGKTDSDGMLVYESESLCPTCLTSFIAWLNSARFQRKPHQNLSRLTVVQSKPEEGK